MRHLKLLIVIGCIGGFLYQTISFLQYYWTYAVVVDFQTTAPEEFSIPAITFCNDNGIKPPSFCNGPVKCILANMIKSMFKCSMGEMICIMLRLNFPRDFKTIPYNDYLKKKSLSHSELKDLKKPIEDFFSCRIVSSAGQRNCKIDDLLIGSYYSDSNFFGVCYTINSRWSQPDKVLEKIKRSDKIEIEFFVNITDRNTNVSMDTITLPKYNYPSSVVIQLGLHHNDASLSPHRNGVELLGGKEYQITLKQEKKHLLPSPYQTNCTDYKTTWRDRGGVGPLNAIMAVEECKYNQSLEEFGCVPFSVDYPHNDSICKLPDPFRKCNNLNYPCNVCVAVIYIKLFTVIF
ncbi:uncharacterized protein TNIN_147631 [Trichonephila inaurata madagascariensis]|uniref:Uncharacterized protein n=1 Tax=Trichonephila inaurata madagascariensis TaxID=2747483 RepID=A0A8X6IRU0_9ARAC|nr:uncharacterized protein TNIN_147631 [Trichonephila inaurata madagascariensis]